MIKLLKDLSASATAGDWVQVTHGGEYTVSVDAGASLGGALHIEVAGPGEDPAFTPDSMKFATLGDLAAATILLGDGEFVRAAPQASSTIDYLNLHPAK